ncbi:MAG: hypothetical protein K9L75_03085 [Spirochaetia bacterium]|nr:hypothetical protein [Spirochaetia bacterium]
MFNAKNREVHIENKAKHQRIDTLAPIGAIAVNSNQESQIWVRTFFCTPNIVILTCHLQYIHCLVMRMASSSQQQSPNELVVVSAVKT